MKKPTKQDIKDAELLPEIKQVEKMDRKQYLEYYTKVLKENIEDAKKVLKQKLEELKKLK